MTRLFIASVLFLSLCGCAALQVDPFIFDGAKVPMQHH